VGLNPLRFEGLRLERSGDYRTEMRDGTRSPGLDECLLSKETGLRSERENVAIRRALLRWFQDHQRDLPWRRTRSAYRIWVSEVMLQQTQVETVIPYYQRFFRQFPSLPSLARSDLQRVLKAWEGLGYYGRARNLLRAAQLVISEFHGRIPRDLPTFRRLPGVGPYIGPAVLSIAFQAPYAAVDGNVKRVLSRLHTVPDPINHPASMERFLPIAQSLLDVTAPGSFNQAMMELGALCCTPRDPHCSHCPLESWCQAWQSNTVERFPQKLPRRRVPTYRVALGVVEKRGQVLITRRAPRGLLGGLWEFPGGTIGEGESAAAACVREIQEETGLSVAHARHLTTVKHAYTHFKVVIDVFECEYASGRVRLRGPVDSRWVSIAELESFPFPQANRKFMPLLNRSARTVRGRPRPNI
jgi:A/G-specific adenine glycosylase